MNTTKKTFYNAKYIAFYNGIPLPFNDERVFAKKIFDYKIEQREGGFDIYELGKRVASYGMSWETKENVEKDYFNSGWFAKHTYPNLRYYSLMETIKKN